MPELILTNDHRYLLDGKAIDGLTSTISEAGLMSNYGSEWYLDRGNAIHLATEFYDRGTLDEATLIPPPGYLDIRGYLESWKRFREDQNYTPTHIEYIIFHPELMVGTKIDRLPLLDIKSGSQEPWHVLQVAFQWATLRIVEESSKVFDWGWTPMDIYLDPDGGPPKVKIYSPSELREAFKVYASMLMFIRWKREKGVKYGSTS